MVVPLWLLAGAALFALLYFGRPLFLPIALAGLFATMLAVPVRHLRNAGIPSGIGAFLVMTVLLAALGLAAQFLSEPAARWIERAPTTVGQVVQKVESLSRSIAQAGDAAGTARTKAAGKGDPISDKIASESVTITRIALGKFQDFAVAAVAMLVLLYFLLAAGDFFLARLIRAFPRFRYRLIAARVARDAQQEIGYYFLTMAMINLGLGTATALVLAWLEMPNPALWGALVALLNFIPYIGPAIVVGTLLLAAAFTFDTPSEVLAVPASFVVLNFIENHAVTPMVVGRRLSLNPVAILVSVMTWGFLWGLAGAIVAVPALVTLKVICQRVRPLRPVVAFLMYRENPPLATQLRQRLRARQTALGEASERPSPPA